VRWRWRAQLSIGPTLELGVEQVQGCRAIHAAERLDQPVNLIGGEATGLAKSMGAVAG
jgi:hypothetical protein